MDTHTIDWADLKEIAIAAVKGNPVSKYFKQSHNADAFRNRFNMGSRDSWYGYSQGQLERWLAEGYTAEGISGLQEFTPPIREKRRLQFMEEGEEFHYDLAASGADNFMSQWTKREVIPGVALEIEIGFTCSTDARVVNAYNSWLCKVAYSLESAGIDCEIMLNLTCDSKSGGNVFRRYQDRHARTRIVVKRENELTDFVSFSPMLSPAAVRSLGFAAQCLHADARNLQVSTSHGYWDIRHRTWNVEYQPENGKLYISANTYHPDEFPEDEMNAKLREALRKMMHKGS